MKNPENNNKKDKLAQFYKEAKSFSLLILVALAVRIFIFEPFHIPSGSMRKTLIEGDYVFSTKYSYGYSKHSFLISPNIFAGRFFASAPQRGDVVIFKPPHQMFTRYIKRLIGLPGEKVEIKNNIVYINDIELKKEFIQEYTNDDGLTFEQYYETTDKGKKYLTQYLKQDTLSQNLKTQVQIANNIGPFHVPDGQYFFLGDNRDQSGDSRFEMGFVPFENFISKAQFIFFSFAENLWLDDSFTTNQITQVWTWLTSFRKNRFISIIE